MEIIVVEPVFDIDIPRHALHLIALQRLYIEKLFHAGIIQDYSVSKDKKTVWITFDNKTNEEVILKLKQFPLYPFMNYRINPAQG